MISFCSNFFPNRFFGLIQEDWHQDCPFIIKNGWDIAIWSSGVPGGPKISNPPKTQNMGPRAKIFGILEYLPKGYLYTKKEQILFFRVFRFGDMSWNHPCGDFFCQKMINRIRIWVRDQNLAWIFSHHLETNKTSGE